MLVAITGGIGVGKSEVLKILAELSTNILSADKINAELLKTPEYIKEIAEIFPEAVSGGAVDKEILSSIIFSDEKKRKVLNGLAHPAIMRSIFERAKNMKGHVFAEVPLLSETQTASMFDKVWLVKCDAKNRISRLINDRGMSLPTVSAIMSAQDDDKIRAKIADEVIVNDGDFTKLRKRVEILYNNLT